MPDGPGMGEVQGSKVMESGGVALGTQPTLTSFPFGGVCAAPPPFLKR